MRALRTLKPATVGIMAMGAALALGLQTPDTSAGTATPDTSAQLMEKYVVTGSNIASAAFNYMAPSAPGGIFTTNADLATYDGAICRMFYAEGRYKF